MRNYNDYNDYYENDYLCHWRPKGSKNGYHDPSLRQQSAKAYRDGENTKGFDRSKVKKKNGILDALGETKIGKAIGAGSELAKRVPYGDIANFEKIGLIILRILLTLVKRIENKKDEKEKKLSVISKKRLKKDRLLAKHTIISLS